MSAQDIAEEGICILSFDSGGPGIYAQLRIVQEYTGRLSHDLEVDEDALLPARYFDFMGGVGFGGLLALMLGHLGMSVNEAAEALFTIARIVFPEGSSGPPNKETNSSNLKKAIEDMLLTRGVPLTTKMYERGRPPAGCKVVLYAATLANINHVQAFRCYPFRGSSLNPTIVDALCATISVPSYFLPVKIGQTLRQQSFAGGALGANNPTRELLKEACTVFGNDKRVAQIVSLGSGLPRVVSLGDLADETAFGRVLKEMAADCELVSQELCTRLFNVGAYLRLNVERGMEGMSMEDWSVLGGIESHVSSYVEATSVTAALDASLRSIRGRIGTITLGQLSRSSSIKVAARTAPSVSPYYVSREKPWEIMVHHLVTSSPSRQRILPITGMGGCGKTQMVSYFLQEYSTLYKHAVFVDASSSSSIKADLQTWSRTLGDGHECDVWEDGLRNLAGVPQDEGWALVLDNADDPTLNLVPFIPKCRNLTIFITSRNRNLGNLSTTHHLELGEMETDEALSTLLRAARRQKLLSAEETKDAEKLIEELGCLAVALVQAGTYCYQLSSSVRDVVRPYTFTQYLLLFKSHRVDLMKKAEPSSLDSYQRGIYTTLDISYKAIPRAAQQFLHFISFFRHTNIPLAALATAATNKFADIWSLIPRPETHKCVLTDLEKLLCVGGAWSELQVHDAIHILQSFSLLSVTSMNDFVFLQLHPLIQAWSRDMVSSTWQHYVAMSLQVLASCSADDTFLLNPYLLPHFLEILEQRGLQDLHVLDLMAAGKSLKGEGHYRNAAELFEATLEKMSKVAGGNQIGTLMVMEWLASTYRAEWRASDAEKLETEILEQRRELLGPEDMETIFAAANLAKTYRDLAKYGKAEELEIWVLDQRRKLLGMEHQLSIGAAGSLALTYRAQHRFGEAEELQLETLELVKKSLGEGHPHTIQAKADLAWTYRGQRRWVEAEKLSLEVLDYWRKTRGDDHPDAIEALEPLSLSYRGQGRFSEATELGRQLLEHKRRILGVEHPQTIQTAADLALTYVAQGRWSEAEILELEVFQQRRRTLGLENEHTVWAAIFLAQTYQHQERFNEAGELLTEMLDQCKRTLGMEHDLTITVGTDLASSLNRQGRWSEAEKLYMEVLERQKTVLGMEHPDTIEAAQALSLIYRAQDRIAEAETLQLEILEQSRAFLGVDHPLTIQATMCLASTYDGQGRLVESTKLGVAVFEHRSRTLGMENAITIQTAAQLAHTYGRQGQWKEAETLQMEVWEHCKRIQGNEGPDTILAAEYLASTYSSQGRWNEAEKIYVESLEHQRKSKGKGHPDAIRSAANLGAMYAQQQRWEDAELLLAPELQLSLKEMGLEDPGTQAMASNLAIIYSYLGKSKEAQAMKDLISATAEQPSPLAHDGRETTT